MQRLFKQATRLVHLIPWVLFVIFVVSVFLLPFRQPFFLMGIEGDAHVHLNYIRSVADHTLYASDPWFLQVRELARGPSELLWYRGAAHISTWLPGNDPALAVSWMFSASCFALYLFGTWRLTQFLQLPRWAQGLVLAIACIPSNLLEGPFSTAPTGMSLSRNSYALYPWLLLVLTSPTRDILKGFAVGLASWMYPFLTPHLGLTEGIRRLLTLRTVKDLQGLVVFTTCALLPFAAILLFFFLGQGESLFSQPTWRLETLRETQAFYVNRLILFQTWRDHGALWSALALGVFTSVYVLRFPRTLPDPIQRLLPYVWIPLPLGAVAWLLLGSLPNMWFTQAWRMPVISAILTMPLLFGMLVQTLRRRQWIWVTIFLLILVGSLRLNAYYYQNILRQTWFPKSVAGEAPIFRFAAHVAARTPPDALILAPPSFGAIRDIAQRATVIDGVDAVLPWFNAEAGRVWAAQARTLSAAYATPDAVALCLLADETNATAVVAPSDTAQLPMQASCVEGWCLFTCDAH